MRLGVLSIRGCLLCLFVGGSLMCEGVVCDPVRADEDAVVRPVASGAVRVATFNCSLNRETAGQLERDLSTDGDLQARRVARVLRTVRPDLVLLNEFDFSESGQAAQLFLKNYLAAEVSWSAEPALKYEYWWSGPVNTGVPTGLDLDHDGKTDGPGDAFGFGRFPGQYGMLLLSNQNMHQMSEFHRLSIRDRVFPHLQSLSSKVFLFHQHILHRSHYSAMLKM